MVGAGWPARSRLSPGVRRARTWVYREMATSALLDAGTGRRSPGAISRPRADIFAGRAGRWPRHDEAAYGLGFCEQAEGRLDAAVRAWERIGPDSPYASLAAVRIAPIALERGRFAHAEDLLRRALARRRGRRRPRPGSSSAASSGSKTAAMRRASCCGRSSARSRTRSASFAASGCSTSRPWRSSGPSPCSRRPPATPPATTASGSGSRTSTGGPAASTKPRPGSATAWTPAPTTPPSGDPGSTGPSRPGGSTRSTAPWPTSPPSRFTRSRGRGPCGPGSPPARAIAGPNGSNSSDWSSSNPPTRARSNASPRSTPWRAGPIASPTSAGGRPSSTGPGNATTSSSSEGRATPPRRPRDGPARRKPWAGPSRPGAGGRSVLRTSPVTRRPRRPWPDSIGPDPPCPEVRTVADLVADLEPSRPERPASSPRPARRRGPTVVRRRRRRAGLDFVFDHDPTPEMPAPRDDVGRGRPARL